MVPVVGAVSPLYCRAYSALADQELSIYDHQVQQEGSRGQGVGYTVLIRKVQPKTLSPTVFFYFLYLSMSLS